MEAQDYPQQMEHLTMRSTVTMQKNSAIQANGRVTTSPITATSDLTTALGSPMTGIGTAEPHSAALQFLSSLTSGQGPPRNREQRKEQQNKRKKV